jgi:hypothetical protein
MHIRTSFLYSEKLLAKSWSPIESPCRYQGLYCLDGSVSSMLVSDQPTCFFFLIDQPTS